MVKLNNNIIDNIFDKWNGLLNDPELKANGILDENELKMVSLCFEIYSIKHNASIDNMFFVVIYSFFDKKNKKYNQLLKRIEYLNNLKNICGKEFDFMYELENLLTYFVEDMLSYWFKHIQLEMGNTKETFGNISARGNDPFLIKLFIHTYGNEAEFEFN